MSSRRTEPSPQKSNSVAVSVKSRTSCAAIERGSVRLEDITYAANRVNQFGLEWIVHLRPQAAHHDFHDIRISPEPDVPNVLGDFCARYDFTGGANQMSEKQKLFRRQVKRHAGTNRFVSLQVEVQIVDA